MRKLLGLVCLLVATTAVAQTTASLTGTVTDANDAPVPGVTVTVTSMALQGRRTTVTSATGDYHFTALPPGDYAVDFSHASFGRWLRQPRLALAQVTRVDVKILPAMSESVIVTAEAPDVITSPHIGTNLTRQDVDRLPVQRNQLASSQLAPGVLGNVLANGQLQISGGPGYDNLVLVNGVVVTENVRSQMRPMYVEDAIQETTILSGGAISAEYGRFTGGVVNTITRSGGNTITGSLRDSISNPSWSAQTPAGEERVDELSHVWEATIGGFILRDRLWFFGAARQAKNDTARLTSTIPAFNGPTSTPARAGISYTEGNDQTRVEAKLTAQPVPQHNVVASFFAIQTDGTNARAQGNIYDLESLTTRDDPESLVALRYGGVLTDNLLLEGQYSRRTYELHSGSRFTDLVGGTVLLDRANNNTRFNAPSLCAVCGGEERNNRDLLVKANWFASTARFGSHEVVAGADRFEEQRRNDNHLSGSDFSIFVTRAQFQNGAIFPVITPTTNNGGGTFIRWNPVLVAARENDLRTDSLFVNDRWRLSPRWSFSLGLRYDRNHAADANGTVSSDDRRVAPRLAVQFDPFANGRQHVYASMAEYSSRIADSIASANQSAGAAATIDFAYRGPAINDRNLTVSLPDAIRMVFEYFQNQQGGTANTTAANLRAQGVRTIPGYSTYFDGSLSSPYVRELTLGYGSTIGSRAYARVDLISRDWQDFYASSVTTATRRQTTPLGIPVDLVLLRNTDGVERTYRGVQLQARWDARPFDAGVFYTYSRLRGNDEGESGTTGAQPNPDPTLFYPEFMDYDRANPIGWLTGDQRHRLRAWAGYVIGPLSFSLLQTFDSGLPYSAAGPINVTRYTGAPANPGYNAIPNGLYYFSDRGAFRADDITSTNLAVRFTQRVFAGAELFAQADLLNAFNRQGTADPQRLGTTVSTAATNANFLPFNPFTETPIECPRAASATTCRDLSAHYQLAPNFGQPQNDQAYQTPRTVRVSVGVRW